MENILEQRTIGEHGSEEVRLSVILTSYNYGHFLSYAMDAVLSQSLQPEEFIVIDDGSTDDSREILQRYARKNPVIRLIENEHNMGVIAAINQGLYLAQGRFIAYAAADDMILPGFLEESVRLLEQYPQASFSTGTAFKIDDKTRKKGSFGSPIATGRSYISPEDALALMRRRHLWFIGCTTVFRRRRLIDAGGFFPELGPFCDSFATQVMALRDGFCFNPNLMVANRQINSSFSRSLGRDTKRSLEIMDAAVKLMRFDFKDIFPDDFVTNWQRVWIYTTAVNSWIDRVVAEQLKFKTCALPNLTNRHSVWHKIFASFILLSSLAQAFFVWLYFFIACRYWRFLIKKGFGF